MLDTISTDTGIHVDIIDLHPNEMQLIKVLRTRFRFGDITIKMQNGVPFRLVRTQEFEDLST